MDDFRLWQKGNKKIEEKKMYRMLKGKDLRDH